MENFEEDDLEFVVPVTNCTDKRQSIFQVRRQPEPFYFYCMLLQKKVLACLNENQGKYVAKCAGCVSDSQSSP